MPRKKVAIALLLTLLLPGCATYQAKHSAAHAMKVENWDQAVYYLLEALNADPGNARLKMDLQRARQRAGDQHFRTGMRFRDVGELERARDEFELAIQLDPTHQYAEVELAKVRKDIEIASQEGGAAKLEAMKKAAAEMKVRPPTLNPASNEPISLSFPNQTNVRDIYKAIGQAFGINILFDPKLRDSKLSLELKDVTPRQALETVMQAAGHFYKVLDPKTIIVVEDTPQNRRDYEDLVVKTFFLSNAEVKDINNMLRSLIDARRIATNEQLNSIVIRDTADKVAIAERLIAANDKAKAEVLVDVELIQVDSNKTRDIGMALSTYNYGLGFDPTKIGGTADSSGKTLGTLPLNKLGDITRGLWSVTIPSVTLNLVKSAGEAETLAQPQLRISEGEKANLVIGDRVPIPTTTFNTTQTVGGNIVPITSFQYQDVGIKIEMEPRVHHNNEVTLKLKVEVSQLGDKVDIGGGQSQFKIGNRTIDSVIRLKDGETSLLAGLYKYSKSDNRAGIPFLEDLPVVGALFRDNNRTNNQTDLVLTITPHIIRNPDITEEDLAPIWVGTENRISISGASPRVQSSAPVGPFGDTGQGGSEVEPYQEPPQEPEQVKPPEEEKPRLVFPSLPAPTPTKPPAPGGLGMQESGTITPFTSASSGTSSSTTATAAAAGSTSATATASAATPAGVFSGPSEGLARLAFYPARLPVVIGGEGRLSVVLDPGPGGTIGPLHLAYDPARLEVTRVEGGSLYVGSTATTVDVTHTPALGWITANWNGTATATGTLVTLTVRPLAGGELPIIFAGPVGAVSATNGTVLGLSGATGALPSTSGAIQP